MLYNRLYPLALISSALTCVTIAATLLSHAPHIYTGEKWITTVWMREGVTADDPWYNSDPTGVRMMEVETE
jgi:hypothetical protein